MAEITLSKISKRFGNVQAVDELSATIPDGEFFVLLGPSGAGKTTTLRLIAGLEFVDSGRVFLDGVDMTSMHPAERDIAFIFQQYSLYPHLSVFDNLAFPLRSPRRKMSSADIETRVAEVAKLLHIESKLKNRSTSLSGGEMQRVAIGRALVREPRVFLMDEPLSSLDAKLREELRLELKRIQRRIGATTVYVTHDQVEATTMADRIGILQSGRLVQVGSPRQIYDDPDTLGAAQRLGSPPINVIPRTSIMDLAVPQETRDIAVRPEDVVIGPPGIDTSLNMTVLEYSPLRRLMILNGGLIELVALNGSDHVYQPGDQIGIKLLPANLLFFDEDGRRIRK